MIVKPQDIENKKKHTYDQDHFLEGPRPYKIEPARKPAPHFIENVINPQGYSVVQDEKAMKTKIFGNEPILKLNRVIGFTGRTCPDIKWTKSNPQELMYASGNVIISSTNPQDNSVSAIS